MSPFIINVMFLNTNPPIARVIKVTRSQQNTP